MEPVEINSKMDADRTLSSTNRAKRRGRRREEDSGENESFVEIFPLYPSSPSLRLYPHVFHWLSIPNPMPPFLLLLSFLFGFDALLPVPATAETRSTSLHVPLHRSLPPLAAVTRLEYVRDLVKSDRLRQRMIAGNVGRRRYRPTRRACENATMAAESFAMPLSSGAYSHTGLYFVRFRLGTPAQRFVLVADTGSDLTWVKCRFGRRECRRCGGRRVFRPEKSVSFDPIRCSSTLCKSSLPFSLTTCPTPASPCAYDFR